MDGSRNATVMAISIFRGYIWYAQINQQSGVGSLNSIAYNLDALDTSPAMQTKPILNLHIMSAELVNELKRRCLKDEL